MFIQAHLRHLLAADGPVVVAHRQPPEGRDNRRKALWSVPSASHFRRRCGVVTARRLTLKVEADARRGSRVQGRSRLPRLFSLKRPEGSTHDPR